MVEVSRHPDIPQFPASLENVSAPAPSLTARTPSIREVIAKNEVTGDLLEPFVRTGGIDVGIADIFGGPVGAATAIADIQDVTVRDAGPIEKAAVYATAPLAVIPLVGKPIGKAARTVAKSVDNIFGMNKKSLTELLDESEKALDISPKIKDMMSSGNINITPKEFNMRDTYEMAKESGFDSASSLFALDPLEISHDFGAQGLKDVRKMIDTKADTLRYRNDDLTQSLTNLFNMDPDRYTSNLESLEFSAAYIGEFISRNIMKGDEIISATDVIRHDASLQNMAKRLIAGEVITSPMAKVENKIEQAVRFGDITRVEADEFMMHYKAISVYDKPLFYMSQVAAHRSLGRHYENKIAETIRVERQGINYADMNDKDFFTQFAESSYNPYRLSDVKQPIAATMPDTGKQTARADWTGETEPLIFMHGTGKRFDIEDFKEGKQANGALQDAFGLHVGTPSQAESFSSRRTIPTGAKTVLGAKQVTPLQKLGVGAKEATIMPLVLKKTRKINEVITEIGSEVGFNAEKFMNNPKFMRNGVITEDGIDVLGKRILGDTPKFNTKNSKPIKNLLMNKGVTYIPYVNKAEDVGDVSVWVLDPRFARHPEKF